MEEELSERLSGICIAAAVRVAQLLAVHLHERVTPAAIDEIRSEFELAVRAAAFEGARNAHDTHTTLTEARLTKPGYLNNVTRLPPRKKPPAGVF